MKKDIPSLRERPYHPRWRTSMPLSMYNKNRLEDAMAKTNTPEEKQIMKLLEKVSLDDKVRQKWLKRLRDEGMSPELEEEIRKKLLKAPKDETDPDRTTRLSALANLAPLFQRWRLAEQKRSFSKH
jgi:hypothetical protein